MWKQVFFSVTWLTLLALFVVACTPTIAPPAPAPLPSTSQATPGVAPTSNLPPVRQAQGEPSTSQDAAWAKIMEAAKKEGLVTNYSFYFSSDIGRAIATAFQEKYGIRVETMVSSGRTLRERIRVEQRINKPIADLSQSGVSTAVEILQDGQSVSIVDELPELRNRDVFLIDPVYDPGKQILAFSVTISDSLINTNLVKPGEEPRSFRDLLDPKWKGKIVLTDPRTAGGGGYQWFTITRFYKVLDDDYFRRFMKQEPALFGGADTELVSLVARGEYAYSPRGGGSVSGPTAAEGAPIRTVSMNEGITVQPEAFMAMKNAPHPNAARLFANWLFSAEGQLVYARAGSRGSVRKDVPNFLHPNSRSQNKPLLNRTYEAVLAADKDLKSGIMDEIFGKR